MDTRRHAQTALCIGARSGQFPLPGGTVRIPSLELKFQTATNTHVTRRFLLDRRHPETLHAFLAHFLGHSIRLWDLDPETLVGMRGPLFGEPADVPRSAASALGTGTSISELKKGGIYV